MAILNISVFSKILGLHTKVRVILPTPLNVPQKKEIPFYQKNKKYQTLYLLHGATGDETVWTRYTNIEWWAQEHCLAVVMPAANNSFYCNMYHGADYLKYFSEELPEIMEGLFPLSKKREHRFIAGNSMGGFGAMRIALEKPNYFGRCCALSAALDFDRMFSGIEPSPHLSENAFGGNENYWKGKDDIRDLFERRKDQSYCFPKIYASCGTEDMLLPLNQEHFRRLKTIGYDVTYSESAGTHNWVYWNDEIQRVLEWLPLENTLVDE